MNSWLCHAGKHIFLMFSASLIVPQGHGTDNQLI